MNLSVVSAKYVAPLKVELHFSDGTVKTIDVGAFIRKHPHPQYNSFFPLGVSTDLQSVVKKCPNLFVFWGFAIPSNRFWLICYRGITNPPFYRSNLFFYGGFQIRRDGIPRFHRSNIFLRRISNPPGRVCVGLKNSKNVPMNKPILR